MRSAVFSLAFIHAAVATVLVVLAILPFAGYQAAGSTDPARFGFFFALAALGFGIPTVIALMVEKPGWRMMLALALLLILPVLAWIVLKSAMGQ